ncbi:MAG TPA: glycerol-3-phosphate 1-O-acyltransferase PlsY [candidate division Zixibacteria bacterium]|nr:glycerol-3-phosphate 1-O-acyltransferase PlsY [candidate division Zixibacteria bacterium]
MAFPEWAIYTLLLIGSYLVGSFPTGFVLGKILKKIDIREFGSGNTGFSNVYRTLGKGPAIITIIGDVVVKGGMVAWAARILIAFTVIKDIPDTKYVYTLGFIEPIPQMFVSIAGILAICGHNWPVWLKFKGGKGMATTAGIFICFVPITALGLTIVWFIVVFTTKYTSLANIVTTPTLPIFIFLETFFIMQFDILTCIPLIVGGLVAGLLLLWSHRENIGRLKSGNERKFGDKSERIENTKL